MARIGKFFPNTSYIGICCKGCVCVCVFFCLFFFFLEGGGGGEF